MMKTMLILFLFSGTLVMFHAEAEENLALNRKVARAPFSISGLMRTGHATASPAPAGRAAFPIHSG